MQNNPHSFLKILAYGLLALFLSGNPTPPATYVRLPSIPKQHPQHPQFLFLWRHVRATSSKNYTGNIFRGLAALEKSGKRHSRHNALSVNVADPQSCL